MAHMAVPSDGQNEYERAFENRLSEQKVRFARVDQSHRCVLGRTDIKTFDYVLYPKEGGCVLVELKGRVFRGGSLAGRKGLQCWVQGEDVTALEHWRERFAEEMAEVQAVFVFAYQVEKMAVDCDGLDVYDSGGRRFVFLAIRHEDYRRCMKRRSVRWKTVSLSAADFRQQSFPAEQIWRGQWNTNEHDDTNSGREDTGRRMSVSGGGDEPVGGVA
jgi:hypothetical protein